jgi:hypothetical protein
MSLLDIVRFIDLIFTSVNPWLFTSLYCLAISFAALINKSNSNTLLLICVLLVLKLLGVLYLDALVFQNENISATIFYFYHGLIDAINITVILFRVKIFIFFVKLTSYLIKIVSYILSIKINKRRSISLQYCRHIEEYKLIGVFVASIIVNILMMIEYQIRLAGKTQFLYIYYLYSPAKVVMSIYLAFLLFKVGFQAKTKKF